MIERTPRLFHDARNVQGTGPAGGRVVVMGDLDGVHRGHQTVLARAVARIDALAEVGPRPELTVLTFEPHPAAVLGASAPSRLAPLAKG